MTFVIDFGQPFGFFEEINGFKSRIGRLKKVGIEKLGVVWHLSRLLSV
jgi:hypothetical protein